MRQTAIRGARIGVLISVMLLPFAGIGTFSVHQVLGISLFDLVVVLFSPFFFAIIAYSTKALLGSVLSLAVSAMLIAQITAALFSNPLLEWRPTAQSGVQTLFILGAGVAMSSQSDRLRIKEAFLVGGLVSLVISLPGFVIQLVGRDLSTGVQPFVFTGPLLGMARFPRLTGTSAHSPLYYAELVFAVTAVSFSIPLRDVSITVRRYLILPCRVLAPIALLLTVSHAVVGVIVLFSGVIWLKSNPSRFTTALIFLMCAASIIVVSLSVNFGRPLKTAPRTRYPINSLNGSDDQLDTEHTLYTIPNDSDARVVYPRTWPYPHLTTVYWHAKQTAVVVALEHLPFGAGYATYPKLIEARIRTEYNAGWSNTYGYPHCQYLTAFATAGIPGIVALGVFVFAIVRLFRKRNRHTAPAQENVMLFGLLGYLAIGLNADVMECRAFWLVTALLLGYRLHQHGPAPQPTFDDVGHTG